MTVWDDLKLTFPDNDEGLITPETMRDQVDVLEGESNLKLDADTLDSSIQTYLSSGTSTEMFIGGTDPGDVVMTSDAVAAARAVPLVAVDFDPQDPAPAYTEGRMFYDENSKSYSYYSDVAGVTINLAQESVTRVYNQSGVTIADGSPVTLGTGTSTEGFPIVQLAAATDYSQSSVLGIATHDIPTSSHGFVTSHGTVGYEAVGLTDGDTMYLGETPGSIVNIPPKIVTVLGTRLSATKVLVNVENQKTLAPLVGMLGDPPSTAVDLIEDVPTNIENYSISDDIFVEVNPATGIVTVRETGLWRCTVNFSATFTADNKNDRVFYMQLYDITDAVVHTQFGFPVAPETGVIAGSFAIPVNLTKDHLMRMQMMSSIDDIDDFSMVAMTFDLQSVGLTISQG